MNRRGFLAGIAGSISAFAATNLETQWREIARSTDGTVGAAALDLDSGKLVTLNGDGRFPLASVCKLPIAMHMLALVDEGKFALDQQIEVQPRDVWSGVSVIEPRWPAQRDFPLAELIDVMLVRSDNTAVETLYRVGGGWQALAARFRQWNTSGVRIDRSERQCGLDQSGVEHYPAPDHWTDQLVAELIAKVPPQQRHRAALRFLKDPRDTGTPRGTAELFARLFRGEALSRDSTARLISILKSVPTFPGRLRGLLPAGTVVAHKTGSSGTVMGLTAATNDSGVIFLPNGRRVAVSVYVKASTRQDAVRDRVIARIARAAYDSWA